MRHFVTLILLFIIPWLPAVGVENRQECRQFIVDESPEDIPSRYVEALLWKVSRDEQPPSYIFGTIHVSDPRVLSIPEPVIQAIKESTSFAMEAVPETEEIITLRQLMFYSGETRLNDLLDEEKYRKAVDILHAYNMSEETITRLKPWAAYLTMNYPIYSGLSLDLVLLEIARQQDMEILGLETISEQLSALTGLDDSEQIQILVDTLCNYDVVLNGFEEMILMYLQRDLRGLYAFSLRHSFPDDDIYEHLYQKLLIDRNYLMVSRLDSFLNRGNAFIAIGALHLAGKEGVLALLNKDGYTIEAIY